MAEENENNLTLEEEANSGKKKMMVIIIAAVVVILLAVVGFFMFSGGDESPEQAPAAAAESSPVVEGAALGNAMYVTMPRPFTFNVPGTTRDRLVQIKVQLMVRGDNNHELAKRHIPLIEGTLLKAFSTANADDLATTAGKDAIKAKAVKDVQKAVFDVAGSKIVEEVLFTGFVMQ
ncbi:flagellar basal body-associated protein FliL [Psychrosphaera aquimarina]|uniref:Flagellar protein FliL n=1 Tax=Psychrosphaera aquimarina TaxID=2044854 RepID=A0ABU3R053_9GAMM|nr:flagellar basal body-associated protein FliL [Psychrosphaera aquimarina]MDU0112842.1 flagellar basal body-associated protein FliL [Psychrosphaera aquimarina]